MSDILCRRDCNGMDDSLLFFFLLLVIIFCNCDNMFGGRC